MEPNAARLTKQEPDQGQDGRGRRVGRGQTHVQWC